MNIFQKPGVSAFTPLYLCMVLLLGCTQQNHKTNDSSGSDNISATPSKSRPKHIKGFLMLEGMKEPTTLNLFETPDNFPLDFSTYIPEDMQARVIDSKNEKVVRIVAAFGGIISPEAFMKIESLPADFEIHKAGEYVQTMILDSQATSLVKDTSGHTWAEKTYAFIGDRSGYVSLAEHSGEWFYILLQYPPEYGDGMGPRSATILKQWRWKDTASPLIR